MRRFFVTHLVPSLLALTVLSPQVGRAADIPEAEKISMETADGVRLRGTWYPSAKNGPKSPAVLMVHKIGADRTTPGWESLAKGLQAKGFAVLSIDLRGHGESTAVKDEFWKQPHNNIRNIKNASPKKEEIDWKQFKASYYPVLVNDLAAAKHALDQKHNAKECNVGDLIIIGAEDGAGLASLFICYEWSRRKQVLGPGNFPMPGDPYGKDIAGAVFLSPRPALGGVGSTLQVPIPGWLGRDPNIRDRTGFFLLYGGKDAGAGGFTKYLYDNILRPGKDAKKKAIFRAEIKDTNLAGADLLKKTLVTEEWIVKYCSEQLMQRRPAAIWVERKNLGDLAAAVPINQLGCKVP